jgi:CDP-paratose 2-epimerase
VKQNLDWLKREHGDLVQFELADTRHREPLRKAVQRAAQIFHFAAQVAVTTSLEDPIDDFETNARGTLNLLEAMRSLDNPPPLIYTSTNKVYGQMEEVKLRIREGRYEPEDPVIRKYGFSEERCIHFHSPYGCSKGCAEQYVLDYARTFGMRTAVFRMSCIYGLHQFGNEDQGWVAHFLIRAQDEKPITIYGDGRQVRDVLFIDDLVEAFLLAQQNIQSLAGRAFNIGGGPANTISLLELVELIGEIHGRKPELHFDEWRSADQQYYVSDTRQFSEATQWRQRVGVREGVSRLYEWLKQARAASNRTLQLTPALQRQNGKTPFKLNGKHARKRELQLAGAV